MRALQSQWQAFAAATNGTSDKLTLLCNADMGPAEMREYCPLDETGKSLRLRAAPRGCVRR